MKWWGWGLVAVALSAAPGTQAADPLDVGTGFYERCVSRGTAVGQMTTCVTYLMGMYDGVRATAQRARVPICFEGEPHTTMEPFVAYLKRNPSRLEGNTADLYLAAMLEAYPCARRPPDKPA